MCRHFSQESFALCNQKEQDNDNPKTLRMLLQLKSTVSTEDVEVCVHAIETTVFIKENYIFISYFIQRVDNKNYSFGFSMINTGCHLYEKKSVYYILDTIRVKKKLKKSFKF